MHALISWLVGSMTTGRSNTPAEKCIPKHYMIQKTARLRLLGPRCPACGSASLYPRVRGGERDDSLFRCSLVERPTR